MKVDDKFEQGHVPYIRIQSIHGVIRATLLKTSEGCCVVDFIQKLTEHRSLHSQEINKLLQTASLECSF